MVQSVGMRLVFAGTPAPAARALERLARDHEIAAVITRPDARRSRRGAPEPSPVKVVAESLGIEVMTPRSLAAGTDDGDALRGRLTELRPTVIPVVAFGAIVPADLLSLPQHGWVNLHFSLLPRWRGAAPVQAAIRTGDRVTGATVFRIAEGLDTGPILATTNEEILPTDTSADLMDRLTLRGAELLADTLVGLTTGSLTPRAQEGEVSYAPKIRKQDARIDWAIEPTRIAQLVRAMSPVPGAWTMMDDSRIKLGPIDIPAAHHLMSLPPGQVVAREDGVLVGTAQAPIRLGFVQPPGKKMMPARDWLNGLHGKDLTFQ